MSLSFRITDEADDEVGAVGRALAEFNARDVGPADRRLLAVLIHDDGALVAGLSGYTAWGWLYVQWLWVDETRRGRGLAGSLLARAEAEAQGRGCANAHIDTFNPGALRAYQRYGYRVFGELPDFVAGRTRWFLAKSLDPGS